MTVAGQKRSFAPSQNVGKRTSIERVLGKGEVEGAARRLQAKSRKAWPHGAVACPIYICPAFASGARRPPARLLGCSRQPAPSMKRRIWASAALLSGACGAIVTKE